ncbi:MAG: CsbD family protein [Candidatus Nephthysia bennettiae]|nr:MAG: CsbD family protein [Candidatus Dormibacteraeota bacterium]
MKDKIQGKAEELKGKVTGDKSEELKGKARQTEGGAKEKLDEATDKLSGDDRDLESR